jgi:hypothetical protein
MREQSSSVLSFLMSLCLAAFVLNWFWEMAQMPAYTEMAELSWWDTALTCSRAALGDAAITLAIVGVGGLASGNKNLGMSAKWNVFAVAGLLGGAAATAYEWHALHVGRWSYTPDMPIVPLLDVGLWPLMQLTVLTPLALWLSQRFAVRRGVELPPDTGL